MSVPFEDHFENHFGSSHYHADDGGPPYGYHGRRHARRAEMPLYTDDRGYPGMYEDEDVDDFRGYIGNEEDFPMSSDPLCYRPAEERDGIPREGIGKMISSEEKPTLGSTKKKAFESFLNASHAAMSSKYADSTVTSNPERLRDLPRCLSASCVDEEIPGDAGVIIVNENKFARVQKSKFARDNQLQKKLQTAAISYMRGLSGLDFSRITNPNVEKKISSLILKDEKSGEPVAKFSPYIMWDTSTSSTSPKLMVDNARGFPSVENDDDVIEAGYMVTPMTKDGLRIHGNYGGKEGKVMSTGQALYFGDALVYPGRAVRMPVWVRLASSKPSQLMGTNVSVTKMDAKMVPLRLGRPASELPCFDGKAVRKLKIEAVDGESSVARKKGEDTRLISASLKIDFEEA